ncbi:MAG: trypsin-like serine protease, partial [Thalassobaculum sp.]
MAGIIGTDDRTQVPDTTAFPNAAVVRIEIDWDGDGSYEGWGTGAMISPDDVLTAAHVLWNPTYGYAQNVRVIPGIDVGSQPFGSVNSSTLHVSEQYQDLRTSGSQTQYQHDVGIINLGTSIGDSTGTFAIQANSGHGLIGSSVTTAGYPGDFSGGLAQYTASGSVVYSEYHDLIRFSDTIDVAGGQSGSPMWVSLDGQLTAVGVLAGAGNSSNAGATITSDYYNLISGWTGGDITTGVTPGSVVAGTNSNDSIVGGNETSDTVSGLGGNDVLSGGGGGDVLSGGDGNDTMYGGFGDDLLLGGAGTDRLSGNTGNDTLSGGAGDDSLYSSNGFGLLVGGDGNDFLLSTGRDDVLSGGSGNDQLWATGGDDTLYGGDGLDTLSGSLGNDSLYADGGSDVLVGGPGDDRYILSGQGLSGTSIQIVGFEAGHDSISVEGAPTAGIVSVSSLGADTVMVVDTDGDGFGDVSLQISSDQELFFSTVSGALGTDIVATTPDPIVGTAGSEAIAGTSHSDTISALDGDDTVSALDGNDIVLGGAGNDLLSGGDGNDSMSGGSGADVLYGGHGGDKLSGGTGDDTIYGGESGWIANHYGNAGNDLLYGSSGSSYMRGGDGDDTLVGGGGRDTLFGDAGADLLSGGSGNDAFRGTPTELGEDTIADFTHDDQILVGDVDLTSLNGTAASGTIDLGGGQILTLAGVDAGSGTFSVSQSGTTSTITLISPAIVSTEAADTIIGTNGAETVTALGGDDMVSALDGDDRVSGMDGNDTLSGGDGSDTLLGDAGDDVLFGGDGSDRLSGGAGADSLLGGSGDDTVIAGSGVEWLSGGAGNDEFAGRVWNLDGDTVADFAVGDSIAVVGADLSSLDGEAASGSIDLGGGQALILAGVGSASGTFSAVFAGGSTSITLVAPAVSVS